MSGIVRRIDDLGRIVIPKEIRKSLKIKEGDNLDIEVIDDRIVFKRYSDFLDIEKYLCKLIEYAGKVIDKDIILFDKKKIICQFSKKIENFINIEINECLQKLLEKREENILLNTELEINKMIYRGNILFSSIIPNGDVVGGIIIYAADEEFSETDKCILEILSSSLKKYIEE